MTGNAGWSSLCQPVRERAYFRPGGVGATPDLFDDRIINYPYVSLGVGLPAALGTLGRESSELFGKGSYEKFVDQPSPI